MRKWAPAFAVLAVLFLLARPICAAQDLRLAAAQAAVSAVVQDVPHAPDHAAGCCDSIEAGGIATHSPLAASTAATALPAHAVVRAQARIAPPPFAGGARPPPPLSYHVRSARIRR